MRNARIVSCGLLFILLLAGSISFAGGDYRENFSKTLPFKSGDRFSLENVNGDVTVATWKEDRVEIRAEKVAKNSEKDLEEVRIEVEESSGRVSVKAVWPRGRRNLRVSVDFEVKIPEGAVLESVETVNGNVAATGRYREAVFETTNGTVTVEDATGDLEASTTNGGVKVRRFEGRLEASSTNGNITLEGLTFRDGIRAETTNGSITLEIGSPETINADLTARTTNGSISVDFPVTLKALRQSTKAIEAKIGEGGPEIALRTTNGSIKITK